AAAPVGRRAGRTPPAHRLPGHPRPTPTTSATFDLPEEFRVHTLDDLLASGVAGGPVLVRSDLNVPLDGDVITDDGRIRASLPTLRALLAGGAKVVVTAHLGRPQGAPEPKSSLAPAATRLAELLGAPVPLAEDFVGPSAKATVAGLG